MPIIKSAKKRVKIAAKAKARNVRTKRTLREALKTFAKAVEGGKAAEIQKAQQEAISALDTAAKKSIIHKNKAARQKASLSAQAKAAGVKPAKSATKKASVKPSVSAKRTPKPTAKKPPAKKPAAKKPPAKK